MNEIKEMEQEEQIEKQMSLAMSMDELSSEDYPLFLTVKRLLFMIDASTDFPFFSRDASGQQIGMETNVQWHNESAGVFMINQYQRSRYDYDGQIKELGIKLLDFNAQIETDTGDLEDYEIKRQPQSFTIGLGIAIGSDVGVSSRGFSIKGRNLSYEIDFETFRTKFWPKVSYRTKLMPLVVWTEIFSEIKGRFDSWKYDLGGIPDSLYIRQNRNKDTFLSAQERTQVYEIFLLYEKWKESISSYDTNDLVNHILRQVKVNMMRQTQQVHFLMVDEVQDLTQNVISLFMMLAEKNVFFSGDTAQTIAKGVGFRFYDLKSVFTRQNYDSVQEFQVPKVLQLAKNFRSHSKILDLANSVVSLLELLFPKTIDRLLKETSDIDGPKPILIDQISTESLKYLLKKYLIWGSGSEEFEGKDNKNKQTQFGGSQVIIVRDQESKKQIPVFMKDMLCLTVYEAKGLEFSDVILYNFFKDSKCESQWKILFDVEVRQQRVKFVQKQIDFLDFEHLDIQENSQFEEQKKEDVSQIDTTRAKENYSVEDRRVDDENMEVTTVLHLKDTRDQVYRKFSQVCTELKLLYVAITRPKNLLMIYDDDIEERKPLQTYWQKVGAVNFVDKKMVSDFNLLPQNIKQVLRVDYDMEGNQQMNQGEQEIIRANWQLQGLKLFRVKYYNAAAQCFQNANQPDLVKRCYAYQSADLATDIQSQREQKIAMSQDKSNGLSKQERQQLKKEAQELLTQYRTQMKLAGKLFAEIDMLKHAAQCCFSGGDLKDSAEIFEKMEKFGPAAECYLKLGQYRKAGQLYAKGQLFANAIDCYERMEDWEGLIICLHKYKDRFSSIEKESLIEKYFPIALNSVYNLYASLDPDAPDASNMLSEENKGRIQQMKLKLKFQKSVSIIQEEISEDEDSDSSSDEAKSSDFVESNNVEVKQNQDTLYVKDNIAKQIPVEQQINTQQKQYQDQNLSQLEESYIIIDEDGQLQEQQNTDIKLNQQDERALELELLSNLDPEDEFLKSSKSYSIIESVSLNDSSFSILSSQSASEYSIISGSKIHSMIRSMVSFREALDTSLINRQSQETETLNLNDSLSVIDGLDILSQSLLDLSRSSVIQDIRDGFAEDMVVQKLIYYVSLFSSDVRQKLSQIRAKNPLFQKIQDQQQEQIQEIDQDKENLDYMLIELDDLEPEFMNLVIDTLDHYEMYRLCILICQRYKLNERIGKFVLAICQKYSNLNQFRIIFNEKFLTENQFMAQKKYALLAHEALHNVLSMVGAAKGSNWINSCFESFFIQGFWKKLVYLMGTERSIELSWAMGDSVGLKLNYLVNLLGISDPQTINEAVKQSDKFKDLFQKSKTRVKIITQLIKSHINFEFSKIDIQQNNFSYFKRQMEDQSKIDYSACASLIFQAVAQQKQSPTPKRHLNEQFEQLTHNDRLNFLKTMIKLLDLGQNGNLSILRNIYQAFGVSILDSLETFQAFSVNFCIIRRDSCIYQEVVKRHELELVKFRLTMMMQKLTELKQQIFTPVQMCVLTKEYMKDYIKNTDLNNLNGMQFALACDLDLDYFLVPKVWVREFVSFVIMRYFKSSVELSNQTLINDYIKAEYINLLNYAQCVYKKSQPEGETTNYTQRIKQILDFVKDSNRLLKTIQLNQVYEYCFGKTLDLNLKSTDKNSLSQWINFNPAEELLTMMKVYLARKADGKKKDYALAIDQIITVKPSFKIFGSKDKNYSQLLQSGVSLFQQAKESLTTSKFADLIYTAFRMFVAIDAYPVLLELQSAAISSLSVNQKPAHFNALSSLLDAHVYAKCNNLTEASTSLLKFLGSSNLYTTINFNFFKEITELAFTTAWFSFEIYNSKEGQVCLPSHSTSVIQNVDLNGSTMQEVKLPDIRITVGNINSVEKALIWVQCLLENLNLFEDYFKYRHLYEFGLVTVQTVLRANLGKVQMSVLFHKLRAICNAVVGGKLEHEFKGKSLVGFRKLTQIDSVVSPNFKEAANLICEEARLCGYVKFVLVDRKAVMARVNQTTLDVQHSLNKAGEVESKLTKDRKESAAKIFGYWSRKLKSRHQSASQIQKLNSYQRLTLRNYQESLVFHGDQQLQTKLRFYQFGQTFEKFCELQQKIIGVLGTPLIQNASDYNYAIEFLKQLKTQENTFCGELKVRQPAIKDAYLKTVISQGESFDAWLKAILVRDSQAEQSSSLLEVERKRYIKREKWNTVIQFHKKKRILLRHLKSNRQPELNK